MQPKHLYKSSINKILAGVCGGIGEYFNIDPVIVRLIFVALILSSFGMAVILYIVAALIIPKAPN